MKKSIIAATLSLAAAPAAGEEVYFDDGSNAWLVECASSVECVVRFGESCKSLGYLAYDMDGKEVDMRAISKHNERGVFAVKCRKEEKK